MNHVELLELIPAVDDHPPRRMPFEDGASETLAERARSAGDEDAFSGQRICMSHE